MANVEELTVDGFIFANPQDVEVAKNEIKKIAYIEAHSDMTNVSMIKSIYEKAIESRSFQTPIGLEYMRELQKAIEASGIPEKDIKPIPLYTTFKRLSLNDSEPVKKRVTKAQKNEMTLKLKYRNAVIIASILGVLVIVMLMITLNGTTPNAMNYKNAVLNQYSSWEQELTRREAAVREKERELNIEY